MTRHSLTIPAAKLAREVIHAAGQRGYFGDIFDDHEGDWREPTPAERCAMLDIHSAIRGLITGPIGDRHEEETNVIDNLARKFIRNAVMNESRRETSIANN